MPDAHVAAKSGPRPNEKPFPEPTLSLLGEPIVAKAKDPVPEHVRAALDLQLRTMLRHEPGTRSGEDPEDLHRMRVSVRRMRAVLRAARPLLDRDWADELRAELGWLGGLLGPVRDLDVLLDRLHEEATGFPPDERAAADALVAGLVNERAQARADMVEGLASQRYAALVITLARATRAPLPLSDSAPRRFSLLGLVHGQYRKLRKAVKRAGEQPPDDELHALRIRGKRLRYSAELAERAARRKKARKRVRALLKAVTRFQDVLGEHQDAHVAEQRVRQLLDQRRDTVERHLAFVAGRLVEREQMRKATCRAQWLAVWHDVDHAAAALR